MAQREIKIKEVEDGLDGAPMWITTFVDMVSLLVTFFILLYTFSSIRPYEAFTYPKNILSTSGVFRGSANDTMIAPQEDLMLAMDIHRGSRLRHTRPVQHLRQNMEEMGQALEDDQIEVEIQKAKDGLRITFGPGCSFEPGGTTPSAALRKSLNELAELTPLYPVQLVIEGHTDDRFLATRRHRNADELSLARAQAAADVLADEGGYPKDLIALEAHGSSNPRAEGAQTARERTLNRRVELRLVSISREVDLARKERSQR